MTVDSVIYRLIIPDPTQSFLTTDTKYYSAQQVKWTTNSTPSLFKYLGDKQAGVALADGSLFLIKSDLLAEDAHLNGIVVNMKLWIMCLKLICEVDFRVVWTDHAELRVYDLQDDTHPVNRIQHASTVQRLYSKFQSAFEQNVSTPTGSPDATTYINIMAMETYTTHDDTLLFALYQDRTIRVWSTGRRQCLQVMRTLPSANMAGYVQETIESSSRAHLRILFNPSMPWVLRLLVYIPAENDAQLSIYTTRLDTMEDVHFSSGSVSTVRPESVLGAGINPANLVKLEAVLNQGRTGYTLWGLWESDMKISAKYLQIDDPATEREQYSTLIKRDLLDGRWWPVAMHTPIYGLIKSMSAVDDSVDNVSAYFADYVFTAGRFSDRTIIRALQSLYPEKIFTLDADLQVQVLSTMSIITPSASSAPTRERNRQAEIMNWTRLISSCAKLDHEASAPLDLSIAQDTGYMIVVKQDSLSFITACDDSEILFHTFQDKQFEVAQLIASPPSRLSKTYPKLQDHTLRQDISRIFSAMSMLTHGMTEESSKNLETIISRLTVMNGPRNFIDNLCQEHLPRYISKSDMNRARNLVSSCKAPVHAFYYLTRQLLYNAYSYPSDSRSLDFILPFESLVASSVQQLANNRYAIAQHYLILVSVISSSPSPRLWIEEEMQLISNAMRLVRSLLVLKWISNRTISPPRSATVGLERQLSEMQVDDSILGAKPQYHRESLTESLLRSMRPKAEKNGTIEFPVHLAISREASRFLHELGLLNKDLEDESRHHVRLAQRLSVLGEMTLLSEFLDMVPVTSSLSYYRGKVLLSQGEPAEALEHFMVVTASFGNGVKSVEQELDVLQSDYTDRAYGVQAKLEDYYNRVISLLTDKDAYEQVIFVARLALINLLANTKGQVMETQVRKLLAQIFSSAMNVGFYESAFNALMQITNETSRKHFLQAFVTAVCDNGNGTKLALFPFLDLQDEVEQLLQLRAVQGPVLARPDNYEVLYAYYVYRGEYRNAATIMCQYARRLCDASNQTDSVLALLNAACSAYLASINALHLAGPQQTWVTITTVEADFEERSKRRKLNPSVNGSGSCKVEVVQLVDLKKEYALTSSKLRLVRDIQSHIIPAALTMSVREVQIMLARLGYCEEATSLALLHGLDLDVVFDLLVDKYLGALAAEQDAASSYKYRLGVVERILLKNSDFELPPWLSMHYLTHNPEDLIRMYLKFGSLEVAARFASVAIDVAMKKEDLVPRHSNARWLPYSLLDEIFVGLTEEIQEVQGRVAKLPRSTAKTKESNLEKRLKDLKSLKARLDQDMREYLENVERESII
ncbi:hypothetical protein BGX31_008649 [Mortierella sp. GBA43]|nr:hypothetical protein BGX31_008649 [Mortierella sp. GBA43]